jgi:hypothetical protein
MRWATLILTMMLAGCTGITPANSFYQNCISYAPSGEGKTNDERLYVVKKTLECGSNSLKAYCETANCSDVALEFDRKMIEHKNKLDVLPAGNDTALEIWAMEYRQIEEWYENNETAFTEADAVAVGNALRGLGNYRDLPNTPLGGQNTSRQSGQSNSRVIQSQPPTINSCSLVRTDRGKATGYLSLYKGSSVEGTSEPNLCTYNCTDGSTKQTTSRGSCPGRL